MYGVGKYGVGPPYGIQFPNFGNFTGTATVVLDDGQLLDSSIAPASGVSTVPGFDVDLIFATDNAIFTMESGTTADVNVIFSTKGVASGLASGKAGEDVGLGWDALDDADPNWTEIQD
mgnify:FL=1